MSTNEKSDQWDVFQRWLHCKQISDSELQGMIDELTKAIEALHSVDMEYYRLFISSIRQEVNSMVYAKRARVAAGVWTLP